MNNWVRYLLGHLVLPFSRAELPGWGKLAAPLKVFGFPFDNLWSGLPHPIVCGKWHGYSMQLDLSDWSQRPMWFTGRYYELDTQLVIKAFLHPGDTFIDVGANIGMITLLASYEVGSAGHVYSFEPNPNPRKVLAETICRNGIHNTTIHECALASKRGSAKLAVASRYNLLGTLGEATGLGSAEITEEHTVSMVPGDEVLPNDLCGRVFLKIDVEGYEPYVVAGLRQTVLRHKPIILTEFYPDHFRRAGSSDTDFINLMSNLDYKPFEIRVSRRWLKYGFRLLPALDDELKGPNILWLHPEHLQMPQVASYATAH